MMERDGLAHIELLTQLGNQQHVKSDKQLLYMTGRCVYSNNENKKRGGKRGWSDEGIKRYNLFLEMIWEDRNRNINEFINNLR